MEIPNKTKLTTLIFLHPLFKIIATVPTTTFPICKIISNKIYLISDLNTYIL